MTAPLDLTAATSGEGQLYQAANKLVELERGNVDADGTPLTDNIQIAIDTETATATITAEVPLTVIDSPDGVQYQANAYLP